MWLQGSEVGQTDCAQISLMQLIFVFVKEIALFGVLCVCVCVCVHIKCFALSAPDTLLEWINFSPQDCRSNIMAKTKLKKKRIVQRGGIEIP